MVEEHLKPHVTQSKFAQKETVDLKIMNVTFQSGLAVTKGWLKQKEETKQTNRLVVDRIVNGKIMKAAEFDKLRRNPISQPPLPDADHHLHHRGALTQILGKSSPRNLKQLRS